MDFLREGRLSSRRLIFIYFAKFASNVFKLRLCIRALLRISTINGTDSSRSGAFITICKENTKSMTEF